MAAPPAVAHRAQRTAPHPTAHSGTDCSVPRARPCTLTASIGGRQRGSFLVEVAGGSHKIEVFNTGYEPYIEYVDASAEKAEMLTIYLRESRQTLPPEPEPARTWEPEPTYPRPGLCGPDKARLLILFLPPASEGACTAIEGSHVLLGFDLSQAIWSCTSREGRRGLPAVLNVDIPEKEGGRFFDNPAGLLPAPAGSGRSLPNSRDVLFFANNA